MTTCPNCKLKKPRWATTNGFVIGNKAYCCMGCGFAGCICLPVKRKKKVVVQIPD